MSARRPGAPRTAGLSAGVAAGLVGLALTLPAPASAAQAGQAALGQQGTVVQVERIVRDDDGLREGQARNRRVELRAGG